MPLLMLLLQIAIFGFLVMLICKIPMFESFREIIIGIAVLAVILYLVTVFSGSAIFNTPRFHLGSVSQSGSASVASPRG